ncbi:hypothetical protein STRDD11_01629 [Streptococcus sp. DD11]|nr:hypothetical protein STRDD11_01629 [Streptococcus sp. DD11]
MKPAAVKSNFHQSDLAALFVLIFRFFEVLSSKFKNSEKSAKGKLRDGKVSIIS